MHSMIRNHAASFLIFAAVIFAPGASPFARAADEVPDDLVKMLAAFDKDVDFATRPICERYVSRLEALKRPLGSRGDARGAAAVQDELDRTRGTSGGAGALAKFVGTWKVVYNHGVTRNYVINGEGILSGTEADGKTPVGTVKLMMKGDEVLMNGIGGFIERFKMSGKTMMIEHWSSKTLYPGIPPNFSGNRHIGLRSKVIALWETFPVVVRDWTHECHPFTSKPPVCPSFTTLRCSSL